MICNDRRCDEAGEFKTAVTVRCAHHGNLDTLIFQSSDTSGPFSLDRCPPFEFEAELAKELNRTSKVFDHDSNIVHPLERHVIESSNRSLMPDKGGKGYRAIIPERMPCQRGDGI